MVDIWLMAKNLAHSHFHALRNFIATTLLVYVRTCNSRIVPFSVATNSGHAHKNTYEILICTWRTNEMLHISFVAVMSL